MNPLTVSRGEVDLSFGSQLQATTLSGIGIGGAWFLPTGQATSSCLPTKGLALQRGHRKLTSCDLLKAASDGRI